MWARVLAMAAGIWLMASPAVLGYADHATAASDRIVGPIAAAASFVAVWGVVRVLRWVTLPLGLWLLVAPWVLGSPVEAAVSDVVAGAVFVATALVRGKVDSRFGGGWSSLREPFPGR